VAPRFKRYAEFESSLNNTDLSRFPAVNDTGTQFKLSHNTVLGIFNKLQGEYQRYAIKDGKSLDTAL
jgi:hypothetical protein